MTNQARWDPFTDMLKLSTAMDQLFTSAFVPASGRTRRILPVNLVEREDAYIVEAAIPGIDPQAVDIQVSNQTLTLKGSWPQPAAPEGATFHLRERSVGQFERTLQLPLPINADAVEAWYEHGLLKLTLPKAEAAKPRHISVTGQPKQLGTQQPVLQEQAVSA